MATYNSLSATQKQQLADATDQLRAFAGQINKLLRSGQVLTDLVASGVGGIVASLDAAEVIPNTSGLANSQDLTKEEVVEIYQDINAALTSFSSAAKRQLQIKAAGVNAL